MSIAPNKPLLGDLTVGMALPTAKFGPMDRFDYIPIALILRDTNPLHLDRVYAQERGLPDTVQQGPLNQAYLYQFFTDWLHQPWDLVSTDIRFSQRLSRRSFVLRRRDRSPRTWRGTRCRALPCMAKE